MKIVGSLELKHNTTGYHGHFMYTSEFKDVAAGTLPAVVHPGGMVMPCRSRLGASFKLSRSCG